MQPSEYAKLAAFENGYWWHVGRRSIVARQIENLNRERGYLHILNVGSGTGGTVQILAKHGKVLNIDQSAEAVRLMQENGFEAYQMDGKRTPLGDGQFHLVAALDVLEHIQEDAVALQEWRRVLKPGGHVVLTVPAYQWLWSGHDVSLGHCRRYTARQLRQIVRDAGFEVSKCSYAITFSFFLIVAFRFYQKLFRPDAQTSSYVKLPAILNSFFIALLRIEAFLLANFRFPFGTSILVIGRKPVAAKIQEPVQTPTIKADSVAASASQ
jgi:SAM-dependent methyltransferase